MVAGLSRGTASAAHWRLLLVGAMALVALALPSAYATSAPAAEATYIVQLSEPPLALYAGGIAGLAPTMPGAGARLNPASAASVAYLAHLASRQNAVKGAIDAAVGRSVAVKFRYSAAYNGMAVQLTESESQRVAALPGVKRVQADETRQLLTDAGPAWIGAKAIHDATGGLPGTKGEGIVVGIIDTGINHDHPSFADVGGDGYNHTNPRTRRYGVCAPVGDVLCNDKLIGMYDFTGTTPFDDNAHGSHTASTVAGNVLTASLVAPTITYSKPISGVAPHANIIAYKACNSLPAAGGCQVSATLGAINQATLDMVHVINFSIGGASRNPWTDPNALAFLAANAAGVFGSVSAGNDGPGSSTIGSPSDAPWVMSVGASTHNRSLLSQLVDMAGGAAASPASITGKSVAGGSWRRRRSSTPARRPTTRRSAAPAPPIRRRASGRRGRSHPASSPGKIVVCDRGTYGRVAKGQEVKDAGGIGMVLANDAASGDSLTADMHVLPALHITFDDGQVLKAWIAAGGAPVARITGLVENTAAGQRRRHGLVQLARPEPERAGHHQARRHRPGRGRLRGLQHAADDGAGPAASARVRDHQRHLDVEPARGGRGGASARRQADLDAGPAQVGADDDRLHDAARQRLGGTRRPEGGRGDRGRPLRHGRWARRASARRPRRPPARRGPGRVPGRRPDPGRRSEVPQPRLHGERELPDARARGRAR